MDNAIKTVKMEKINQKNIEDICLWHKPSRNQRDMELEKENAIKGIEGYAKTGCHNCDGHNYSGKYYHGLKKTKKRL